MKKFPCAFLVSFCTAALLLALPAAVVYAKPDVQNAAPPVAVEVAKVVAAPHTLTINATGSLLATQGINVCPEIPGRVTKIYFASGQMVKRGDKLVELNADVLTATLAQSEAQLKLAEQNYARYNELYKTHTVSKADLDQMIATRNAAEAAMEQDKARLQQATIVAPFDGKIGLKKISLGDYVNAGQTLTTLQAIDPIDVEFSVPEIYLNELAVGQKITLTPSYSRNATVSGAIYAIDAAVNQTTRSIMVRARVANPDAKLIPGSFAEVTLSLGEKQTVLMMPQTAICYEGNDNFVYKVENTRAIKTKVTLGERDQENVVVLSGLKPDESVVVAGLVKIYDGASVIVTDDASATNNAK